MSASVIVLVVGGGFVVLVWLLPPQPAVAATAAVIPAPARNLRRERSSVKSLGSFFTCEASFADQAQRACTTARHSVHSKHNPSLQRSQQMGLASRSYFPAQSLDDLPSRQSPTNTRLRRAASLRALFTVIPVKRGAMRPLHVCRS